MFCCCSRLQGNGYLKENQEVGGGGALLIVDPLHDTAATQNENDTGITAESPHLQDSTGENNEDKFSNENHADVAPLDVVADAEEETSRGKDDAISVTKAEMAKTPPSTVLLPACVVRFMKCQDPLVNDYDYFEAMVAVKTLRSMTFKLSKTVSGSFTSIRMSSFGDSKSSTVQKGKKLVQAFQELLEKLEAKRARFA